VPLTSVINLVVSSHRPSSGNASSCSCHSGDSECERGSEGIFFLQIAFVNRTNSQLRAVYIFPAKTVESCHSVSECCSVMLVSLCRWSKRAAAASLPSVRCWREELLAFYMSFVAVFPRCVDVTNAIRIEWCLWRETYLYLCAFACNLFLLLSVLAILPSFFLSWC